MQLRSGENKEEIAHPFFIDRLNHRRECGKYKVLEFESEYRKGFGDRKGSVGKAAAGGAVERGLMVSALNK